MAKNLTEFENLGLGVTAAFIESIILQPTLYWKNAKAQGLPLSINPKIVYRGTGASIYNECQMMGLQFGFTGFAQSLFQTNSKEKMTMTQEIGSAAFGGFLSSFFTSPVELIMIQQQRYGGSVFHTVKNITKNHGFLQNGLFRGMASTICRDSIYVASMLGVTPLLQTALEKNYQLSPVSAGLYASLVGGLVATIPSHPFDILKTCMQGDLTKVRFTTISSSLSQLIQEGGMKRLFAGCFWRSVNIIGTIYIANECRQRFPKYILSLRSKSEKEGEGI